MSYIKEWDRQCGMLLLSLFYVSDSKSTITIVRLDGLIALGQQGHQFDIKCLASVSGYGSGLHHKRNASTDVLQQQRKDSKCNQ